MFVKFYISGDAKAKSDKNDFMEMQTEIRDPIALSATLSSSTF